MPDNAQKLFELLFEITDERQGCIFSSMKPTGKGEYVTEECDKKAVVGFSAAAFFVMWTRRISLFLHLKKLRIT